MSWDNGKAEEAAMVDFLAETLQPKEKPLVLTWEMRKAVIKEFSEFINSSVPTPHDYIVRLALLDYSCRKLAAEPDEEEGEDQSSELYRPINLHQGD